MKEKEGWGKAIRQALREILGRCRDSVVPMNVPGEGGERPLRGWLINPFLPDILGWPSGNIVQGERFDLRLTDFESFPVVYIETKTPGHIASHREREDFENRIKSYGTLRAAFLTNGRTWERLDIIAPRGNVTIHDRFVIDLERCTDEEAEAFFLHLKADRYLAGGARTGRSRVSKDHPHILESLASDLDQGVDELSDYLERLFEGYERGDVGTRIRDLTIDLFDHWCRKSLIVPLQGTAETIEGAIRGGASTPEEFAGVLQDLGFSSDAAQEAADAVATLGKKEKSDRTKILDKLLSLYRHHIATLAAQSAHVILARTLIYRIGEDQKVFPVEMSGKALEGLLATAGAGIGVERYPAMALCRKIREGLETFLPSVFQLGEFDWWWIPPEKRSLLAPSERARQERWESEHEVILQRILRTLDGYYFGEVDVDVWRNVYQHYLPDEERQKLGGFYTPDELVDLVLDLCGYLPENPELSKWKFIDPACGSGAFVTAALSRLLRHFEPGNPGFQSIGDGRLSEWQRAEAVLRVVEKNLHAIDIHPFAAFLTTINVMFLLLPAYVQARRKNPDFSLELRIFSADSLEKPDAEVFVGDLFQKLNSRIQLSAGAMEKYRKIIGEQFDFVFGNPPWGGVLKGPLAPVFDEVKKKRFRREYPSAATGKYDIYGLFMERGLQILKPGGCLGLLTQDTYLDKEWASSLRKKLATDATVRMVIDLNPFGHLFFRAMNTPAITVLDNEPPHPQAKCLALLSRPEGEWKKVPPDKRRAHVIGVIRKAIAGAEEHGKEEIDFASACTIPLKEWKSSAGGRWNLSPSPALGVAGKTGLFRVSDLFDPRQGVTPGGCLDIFLMNEARAAELKLEKKLLHRAIKSREFERWRTRHTGRVLLYPYVVKDGDAVPAFALRAASQDALDFETPLDEREKEVRRGKALDAGTIEKILGHRIAKGIVKFPNTAMYLSEHYELLEGRVFKKKNIRSFNRRWYEYLWPRDPKLMLASIPRIVSPGLCKQVKFALDAEGFLSDHACQFLFPRHGASQGIDPFSRKLSKAMGREVGLDETLLYCLAFLNSPYAQDRLVSGHRPTPKGFYQISEEFLKEIPVALPRNRKEGESIIASVKRLVGEFKLEEVSREEACLFKIVTGILTSRA